MASRINLKLRKKNGAILWIVLVLVIASVMLIASLLTKRQEQAYIENQYNIYCGSCHLAPNPSNIPKSLWKSKVLPEMAKRMGLKNYTEGSSRYSDEEIYHIQLNLAYPETALVDNLKWQQLSDYVLSMAPDNVPNAPIRKGRNAKLTQFSPSFKTINRVKPKGSIVNIKFNEESKQLLVGDVFGQLFQWKNTPEVKLVLNSPVVSSVLIDNTLYVTEIGIMTPSEIPKGVIYRVDSGVITPITTELHRPVFTEINDLNGDGENEIIVCEFGHITGKLSLFVKKGSVYNKKTLLELPGSVKVEVVDMNGDGKKDIVALFAQGREGVYVFYQKSDLEFNLHPLILMPPEYGSSWFSLIDYNFDGHLDILLANGDNADYSRFLKPYHGVRLFLNNGKNEFSETWFYPINGATRVLVDDFDKDGDLDFAVSSFFPDFDNCLEEGFVYLENMDTKNFMFTAHATPHAKNGNWLIMEKGDFDDDGDIDIMLGNFSLLVANQFKSKKKGDLLFLENKLFKN